MLQKTDVSPKLPIYMSIWVLLLSYLTIQFLQTFLYTKDKYRDQNYADARIIAAMVHDVFIYIAIFLILWHTYRINNRTMSLVQSIAQKKEIAANRVGNRRTGNFSMARPKVDASGNMILANSNPDSTSSKKTESLPEKEVNKIERDRAQSDVISNVVLPRKPGFRQIIENKLGIDYEHSVRDSSDWNQSLQTN